MWPLILLYPIQEHFLHVGMSGHGIKIIQWDKISYKIFKTFINHINFKYNFNSNFIIYMTIGSLKNYVNPKFQLSCLFTA